MVFDPKCFFHRHVDHSQIFLVIMYVALYGGLVMLVQGTHVFHYTYKHAGSRDMCHLPVGMVCLQYLGHVT